MPEDYYGEDETVSAPAPTAETQPEPEESGDEQTFVLPKAIAGGRKFDVGDEMVVEIVADHEDSYEVKYASEKRTEEQPAAAPAPEPEEEEY